MGPPTENQRIDQLEEKAMEIEETMADMVAKAVKAAMGAVRASLTGLLVEGQTVTARKQGEEMDALVVRLEGQINGSRKSHEQMFNLMRNE